jgi:hypothetical protein
MRVRSVTRKTSLLNHASISIETYRHWAVPTLIWLDPSSPELEFGFAPSLPDGDDQNAGARNDPTGCEFSSKAPSLSRLFLLRQGGGPGHDAIVTTVDQSDIRVLVNALNDPTGAASLYVRASAPKYRPKGGTRIPPPVHASWTGPPLRRFGPSELVISLRRDSLTHRSS